MTLALFFYLIPIQLVRNFYPQKFRAGTGHPFGGNPQKEKITDLTKNVIQIDPAGAVSCPLLWDDAVFYLLWGIVAAFIIGLGLVRYYRQRKQVMTQSEPMWDPDRLSLIEEIKKQTGMKRKILCRVSHSIREPLSIGIFRPVLLLPDLNYSKQETEWICRHELIHIKNGDTLDKLLSLFAIGLHWYNPAVYFLFRELNHLNETVCDETIALSSNEEERRSYARLILKTVTENHPTASSYTASFGNDSAKRTQRRVLSVINARERKKRLKLLSGCIMAMLGLTGSLTVFAYEPPTVLRFQEEPGKRSDQTWATFVSDDVTEADMDKNDFRTYVYDTMDKIKIPAEQYFEDKNGNLYEVNPSGRQRGCAHTYESGTYNAHERNGEGCSIRIHKAQRCSKCGYVIIGALENTLNYTKCPHEKIIVGK